MAFLLLGRRDLRLGMAIPHHPEGNPHKPRVTSLSPSTSYLKMRLESTLAQAVELTAYRPSNHWNARQAIQPVQKHTNPYTRIEIRIFMVATPVKRMGFPAFLKQKGGSTN